VEKVFPVLRLLPEVAANEVVCLHSASLIPAAGIDELPLSRGCYDDDHRLISSSE
jgi:hypothetical protein